MTERETTEALQTIDTALAEGRVTAADPTARELQELALVLTAGAPAPRSDFALAMDERLANGFKSARPPSDQARGERRYFFGDLAARLRAAALPSGPSFTGALAAALLVLAVVGVGVGVDQLRGGSADPSVTGTERAEPEVLPAPEPQVPQRQDSSPDAGSLEAAEPAIRELQAQADDAVSGLRGIGSRTDIAPLPPTKRGEALAEIDRRVERSAFMTLAAPADELPEVGSRIADVARRNQGFVLNSSLTTGEEGTRGGQFELRVPVERLDAALAQLADVGELRALTQDDRDVTAGFEVIEDRLDEAMAERRGLLRRLAAASTETEAAVLRRELRRANRAIEGLRDNQRRFDRRVSFAAISVTLEKDRPEASGSLARALDDAGSILVAIAGFTLRGLAVFLPLGLVALAAYAVARVVRRRRRESALE